MQKASKSKGNGKRSKIASVKGVIISYDNIQIPDAGYIKPDLNLTNKQPIVIFGSFGP